MPGRVVSGPESAPATPVYGSQNQRAKTLRGTNVRSASFAATTTSVTVPFLISNQQGRLKLTISVPQTVPGPTWYILFGATASSTNYTVALISGATAGANLVYEDSLYMGPVSAVANGTTAPTFYVTEVW